MLVLEGIAQPISHRSSRFGPKWACWKVGTDPFGYLDDRCMMVSSWKNLFMLKMVSQQLGGNL